MAHGREGPDIVMTIRYATASDVKAVTDHELNRTPDGSSAIDPTRSALNMVLHGPESQQAALSKMRANGVKGPAAQSEAPYVQMVLSASPSYFRPNGEEPGDWDDGALDLWRDVTMDWLQREYGADLAHVSMHLDEDTPHMHVLIVPTYEKKARRPGRQKKNETDEEFTARVKAAEERSTTRTIGRSSNTYWSQNWARRNARKSYHAEVERQGLSLGYGRDFVEEGQPSPMNVTTGHWVRQQAADNVLAQKQLDADAAALTADRNVLTEDRAKLDADAAALTAGRNALTEDRAKLDADAAALAADRNVLTEDRAKLDADAAVLAADRNVLTEDRAKLDADAAALTADRNALTEDRAKLNADYNAAFSRAKRWSEQIKSERIKLDAEKTHVRKLAARLSGLMNHVEQALKVVAEFAPRIRRVLKDAEASREDRFAAAAARAEIADVVPALKEGQRKTQDIMQTLRMSSAPEETFEPVEDAGPGIDGP